MKLLEEEICIPESSDLITAKLFEKKTFVILTEIRVIAESTVYKG